MVLPCRPPQAPGGFPPAPPVPSAAILSETSATPANLRVPDETQVNSTATSSQPGAAVLDTSPTSAASDVLKMAAETDAIVRERSIRWTGDHPWLEPEQAGGGEHKASVAPDEGDLDPTSDLIQLYIPRVSLYNITNYHYPCVASSLQRAMRTT